MFPCQFCGQECDTILSYTRHMRIHRNIPNATFRCGLPICQRTYNKFAAFKTHQFRHHTETNTVVDVRLCRADLSLKCHMDFCSVSCDDLKSLFCHLKTHIAEGTKVTCPFRLCNKTFSVKSTFTSHLSRNHKSSSEGNLVDSILQTPVENPGSCHEVNDGDQLCDGPSDTLDNTTEEQSEICPESADEALFLKSVALFYLKLQAKLLLPSSVIQTIVEEFQDIHSTSQSHLYYKLREKLVTLGISEADIKNVIEVLKTEDLFTACNSQTLKTDQRRKTVFNPLGSRASAGLK